MIRELEMSKRYFFHPIRMAWFEARGNEKERQNMIKEWKRTGRIGITTQTVHSRLAQ